MILRIGTELVLIEAIYVGVWGPTIINIVDVGTVVQTNNLFSRKGVGFLSLLISLYFS